ERGTIHFDGAEFAAHIREVGADVLIVEADLVHAEVLNGCRLRMIGCCRGDPVNVDLELATAKGVPVFHAPGRNADAVADLTLAFMLMLARRLPAIQEAFRGGDVRLESAADFLALYTSFTGFELGGLTIGLVGLGAVGREVARRLLAFRARVIAADPHPAEVPPGVALVELDDLLREADIVSLHAPLMLETHGLLSRGRLALLKPSAFFINTARAHLADEDALYEMLRDGRLAGAALDVLSDEPLRPGHRFLALPSAVVTPHVGGATVDVVRHQSAIVVDAIERYLRGERPRWIANPAVLDGRR
ncbi:MAG: 3-phosphoglycerate dehydrogenase, partial [Deltaproteobacteria bacterium]